MFRLIKSNRFLPSVNRSCHIKSLSILNALKTNHKTIVFAPITTTTTTTTCSSMNGCCRATFSTTVITQEQHQEQHSDDVQQNGNKILVNEEQRQKIEKEFQQEYTLLVDSGKASDGSFDETRFKHTQELLRQFVKLIDSKSTAQRAFVYQFNLDCLIYFQLKRENIALHARELLAHTNRLLECEHVIRKLIDHNVWFWRFTDFHLTRGLCFMSLKQMENALESFNYLVDKKLKPILQHPQVKEGNEEDEEKRMLNTYYKTALKNRFSVLLELKKLDRALGDISKYNEIYRDEESTYLLAYTHELLGQYNEALSVAKRLLLAQVDKEWRTKAKILLTSVISKCYKQDKPGAQDAAIKMCDELIDFYPDAFDLYLTRSMLHYHRNDTEKALADSEEYLKRGGSPLLIYEIRYNCLMKLQQYEQILAETDDLLANMSKNTRGIDEKTVEALKNNLIEGRAKVEQLLSVNNKKATETEQ